MPSTLRRRNTVLLSIRIMGADTVKQSHNLCTHASKQAQQIDKNAADLWSRVLGFCCIFNSFRKD